MDPEKAKEVFDTDKKIYGCGYYSTCMEPLCHMGAGREDCPLTEYQRSHFTVETWTNPKLQDYPCTGMP